MFTSSLTTEFSPLLGLDWFSNSLKVRSTLNLRCNRNEIIEKGFVFNLYTMYIL